VYWSSPLTAQDAPGFKLLVIATGHPEQPNLSDLAQHYKDAVLPSVVQPNLSDFAHHYKDVVLLSVV